MYQACAQFVCLMCAAGGETGWWCYWLVVHQIHSRISCMDLVQIVTAPGFLVPNAAERLLVFSSRRHT